MNRRRPYTFGVSEFTTWPWSFERDVDRYAAHEIDAIEICEFKLDRDDYAPQLRRVGESGLHVSSVQTTVHSLFPDSLMPSPLDPADRMRHIREAMERIFPHVPPGTPFVLITGAAPNGDCNHVWEYSIDALRSIADFAYDRGFRVAFEPLNPVLFHTDTALWGLDDGLELVRRVGHPGLGLCVDTWNVFQTPDLERVIAACADKIFLVQVSDWARPRNNADRRSIGEGEIPTAKSVALASKRGLRRAIRSRNFFG